MNLDAINRDLATLSPQDIIASVLAGAKAPVLTTNFGPHEAAILHMVTRIKPDIPVIWIDSGYGTNATYRFARQLINQLGFKYPHLSS